MVLRKGELVCGVNVDESTGAAIGVQLKSGDTIEGDIFVIGIGARPNTEAVRDQLTVLDKAPGGILCDGRMQTSVPDVYAIGDIAA